MRKLATISIAAALAALMALASPALASGPRPARATDRNHDGLPDSWERHFHLTLRVNQARRNPDHDGLNNLQEFRDRTNPRKADTDGDGIRDGAEMRLGLNPRSRDSNHDGVEDDDEHAGTIASFDGTTLTITPAAGGAPVSGTVDATTRIECETAEQDEADEAAPSTTTARASEDGDRSGSGDVTSGESNTSGENEQGDDEARTCTTADLTQGTPVHEAELENGVFKQVELVK